MKRLIIPATLALAATATLTTHATATQHTYPYETTACWSMDNPTLDNANTYQWPQTRVDCSQVPASNTAHCGPSAKYQIDTYWIRDDTDRDYLAGLTIMTGPESDARLEPHGYYAVTVTSKPAEECVPLEEPTPTPTPTVEPTPTVAPEPTPTPSDSPTIPTPDIPPVVVSPTPQPPHTLPPIEEPPTVGPAATRSDQHCLGDALVTKTEEYIDGGWQTVETSIVNGAKKCSPTEGAAPVKEEGF